MSTTFAHDLKVRLSSAGLSISGLARHVGVTPQAVSLYVHGGALPSPATAARIREALPGLEVPERRQGKPRRKPVEWPVDALGGG